MDITQRKHAEEKLKRLSQFPEENPNPVLRVSPDGLLLYANTPARRWLAALGVQAGAPLPEPVNDAVVEVVRQDHPVETEISDPDGRTFAFFAVRPSEEDYINFYGTDITARKLTEIATERQNVLLGGINRIFETVVTSAGDHEFGAACLAVAEEITGSAISFLGEIGPDGLLHEIAISNPAWEACALEDRQGRRRPSGSFHVHGIFGGVLTDGRALLTNDPAAHPDRVGLPTGHPKLTAFLGAPLKQGDTTIGMIAVGNRQGGYGPEHQETLTVLARVISEALLRQRAEAALRDSEARYRSLFQNNHAVMLLIDPSDGRIVDANPAACAYYGYTQQAMTGLNISDINALSTDRVRSEMQSARSMRRNQFNFQHRLAGGEIRDVEVFSGPVTIAGRALLYSIVHDITDRKRVEEALQKSEERQKRAQEIAHLGSWELDLQTNELTWSDEAYRIFGLPPRQHGMTYGAFLDLVHPEDRPKVAEAYGGSLREGRDAYEVEHRIVRPDGEIRHVHEKCEHQRDGAGGIIRSVGMVHDITERKRAAQALERSNKELEQFAYAASHDLQEPLRSIMGFLQLLRDRHGGQLDPKGRHYIERAMAGSHRLQALIRDLLSLSRVSTSGATFSPTNLNRLVETVLDNLESTLAEKRGAVACAELPRLSVDASQIESLFQNLIMNAVKYNENPHPRVEIGCQPYDNGYRFFVADNGLGIPPRFHERIFMVFQRLHTEREYPGTGLGLALCQKIVERHGGTIWVESQPRKGAIFYFTLPGTR